jgi:DNA-3-methyladenine glycosylase I
VNARAGSEFEVGPFTPADREWAAGVLTEAFGGTVIVSRDVTYDGLTLRGFVARQLGRRVGLVTYALTGDECEVVSLNSLAERAGIGSALLGRVREVAANSGCWRIFLLTSNDNIDALRFYQKRGYRIVAVHRDAMQRVREAKPAVPLVGRYGIPLLDEIELEVLLRPADA